jgi:hypothetical protein
MEQDFRRYCRSQLTFVLVPEFIVPAAFLRASAFLEALEGVDSPIKGTQGNALALRR